MEISVYLRILSRRRWIIFAVTIITFAVASFGRAQMPVKYTVSSVVRVSPYTNTNPSYTQIAYADRIMKTYVEIGSGSTLMTSLRGEMGLTDEQPNSIEVNIIPDTELLRITVSDYDPSLASEVANTLAAYLINDRSIRDVRLVILEPATIPEPPSKLVTMLFYVVSALAGMVGGVGLAFLLEGIDTCLYEEKQVENLFTLPVLGYIPWVSGWYSRKLKIIAARYPYNHSFRRLVAGLLPIVQGKNLRTIMVASPEPHEGKTTVAVNLAYSLSQSGYKTLLIDADLYRSTLHNYFDISRSPGLSDLLFTAGALENVIQPTSMPLLWVIPSGTLPKSEEDLLDYQQLSVICRQLARQYDFIILDSPAILGVSDGLMFSPFADGVLIVVRLGITRRPALETAFQQLAGVRANIIGFVLNATNTWDTVGYYRYYEVKRNNPFINLLPGKWRTPNPTRERSTKFQSPVLGFDVPIKPSAEKRQADKTPDK